ncbi:MAG: biotin transporter BioY [Candidatus Omnitrophota bacterium]
MDAILKREVVLNKTICKIIGVSVFVILTSLGAFVRIPLPWTPVPLTLQTFFVLLSGAFLGAGLGSLSQIIYMVLGISGISIFTSTGSGWLYIAGPTGGYLVGFIAASWLVGKLIRHFETNLFFVFALFCLSDFVILASGALWLKLIFNLSFYKMMGIGFMPFILGDLLKSFAAASIYLKCRNRVKVIFK